MSNNGIRGEYGISAQGNFYIDDIIGVPHPYCIGAKHVSFAADNYSEILSKECIEDAESHGIYCDICKQISNRGGTPLSYAQHETALVVKCKADFKKHKEYEKELQDYLVKCKDECEKNGYAGFAFVRV